MLLHLHIKQPTIFSLTAQMLICGRTGNTQRRCWLPDTNLTLFYNFWHMQSIPNFVSKLILNYSGTRKHKYTSRKVINSLRFRCKKNVCDFNLLKKIHHGKALPCFAPVPFQKLFVPESPVLLLCAFPWVLLLHLNRWLNSNKTGWVVLPQPVPSCLKQVTCHLLQKAQGMWPLSWF